MTKKRSSDYVEFGSDRHAMLLGLRKAEKDDELQRDGWTLEDLTAFGPAARPEYLREVLRQKVSALGSGPPPTPQSDDPLGPHYAPSILDPAGELIVGR